MEWLEKQFSTYLPMVSDDKMIQASLIVLIAAIASRIVRAFISRLKKHAAGRTNSQIDDHLLSIIQKPAAASVLLIGIYLAVVRSELFGDKSTGFIQSILITIAVFYWLRCVLDGAKFFLGQISHDDSNVKIVQKHTLPLFQNIAVIIIYGAAVYFVFVAWDIDVSAWIASAGILGLALSFAAKDTLANLFAGVFILADTPYKIGDFVVLESGERGMVTHIGIRSTRLLTRDDVEVTIPNAIMGNTKIINETAGPSSKYRIRISVGVAYGSDIDKVRAALLKAASTIKQVEDDPSARVRFRTFGDSSLNFDLLCWVAEPVLRGQVSDLLNEAVYNEFNQQGITIPFPQRDVNLRQISS